MDILNAITMFGALSQETRLSVFRILVSAGVEGIPAGELSEELGTPHNTMSFHLNQLVHSGLVKSKKQGRSVIYSANYEAMNSLLSFLVKDCCNKDFASIRENKKTGNSVIELFNCCDH